jgi:hypothetical protein
MSIYMTTSFFAKKNTIYWLQTFMLHKTKSIFLPRSCLAWHIESASLKPLVAGYEVLRPAELACLIVTKVVRASLVVYATMFSGRSNPPGFQAVLSLGWTQQAKG